MLAACTSSVTPTPTSVPPTLTPTSRFSTHEGPVTRATLPPTWTNTPTPLPTSTLTPTPITPTPTLTPVPGVADICPSFTLDHEMSNGQVFNWSDTLRLVLGTTLSEITTADGQVVPLVVRFLARNPLDGENLGAQLPGGDVAILELPIYQLPEPGLYRWTVSVYGEGIGDQCEQGGWFIVVRTADDLAALETATVQAADAIATAAQSASDATATADATEAVSATQMVE